MTTQTTSNAFPVAGVHPIFLGELITKHIQSEYSDSVVLVVFADENGLFEKGVLEAILEKEVLRVLCGDISEIAAIELSKDIAGKEVDRLIRILSENSIDAVVYERGKIR